MELKTRTEGAIRAGNGRHAFDLTTLATLDAGPGYSTAHGPVVEGERIQIGLMRMPRGTDGRPQSHPNEQWIYVLEGTLESEVGGVKSRAPVGSLKDMTHGIAGTPVDTSISAPLYAPGFEPKK